MKLLVTGGAGYIGSVVAHQLVAAGHQVEIIDDLSTGHMTNLPGAATFHRMSIHQAADIITPDAGFDGVLHFAASIEVAESVRNPEKYWYQNIEGGLALLRAIRGAGVPRLVFSSTGSLYHGDGTRPFDETAEIRPQNPYAATKATIDMMIAGECGAGRLGAVSLRYFNACGAAKLGDGRWLGERHDPESHLIPILLQTALGERESFTLYGTDYPTEDGTCRRDYVDVRDLCDAHLMALDVIEPGRHEIFNLGNGQGFSNRQVLETVKAVTGVDFPVVVGARRPGDPAVSVASNEKAHRVLGWKPTIELVGTIASAWEFHQAVHDGSAQLIRR
ncbi:UDP-glucose 4-epimerase GalE [Nocardia sp. CNY236]|uniref:UDP-glucose 4-epimerase GalE n=1 Tax=Nocardia sp. CNY236 TaxID=1169152 RepID=UPI0004212395|nr:UDP-glucose 4-epimerase GalE [Nocardia sp. CNY236]